ncbi:helix-hairpin-helix domain-containing protein [Lysobacter korlensis]|uniref:Helix-hairpin-helix domain-containing protein n=1 Tax=Lysobacter korlensis TaxID=553636 RepID=A0ABV6RMN1_9GAMM
MGTRSAARTDGARAASRLRTTVGGAIVLLLVAGAAAVLSFTLNAPGGPRAVGDPGVAQGESVGSAPTTEGANDAPILVHVLGAVAAPGLYELSEGERIVDAVAAAGGFAPDADQAALNLARAVADGEQVYVPVVGEEPPVPPDAGGGLVNLNTADAAELETLPGLGPELAGRIVEWRTQHGPFSSVDDLLNVTGIGAKTLSALADLVTT